MKKWLITGLLAGGVAAATDAQNSVDYRPLLKKLKPKETNEVLLIGVANMKTMGIYHTIVLDYKAGKVPEPHTAAHLVVPHPANKDLWYLQITPEMMVIRDTIENYWRDEYPAEKLDMELDQWSLMLDKDSDKVSQWLEEKEHLVVEPRRGGEPMSEYSFFQISFAGGGFFNFYHASDGFSGGAHPYHSDDSYVRTWEDMEKKPMRYSNFFDNDDPIPTTCPCRAVYSAKEWAAIQQVLLEKGERGEFIDGAREDGGDPVDTTAIQCNLVHKRGAVYPVFLAYANASYVEQDDYSYTAQYEHPQPVPASGYPANVPLPLDVDALMELDGGTILDFTVSPSRNVLLLIKAVDGEAYYELVAIHVKTGKVLAQFDVSGGIVSLEWASGDTADKWLQSLPRGE